MSDEDTERTIQKALSLETAQYNSMRGNAYLDWISHVEQGCESIKQILSKSNFKIKN